MEKRIISKMAALTGKKTYRHGKELPLGFTLVGAIVAFASAVLFIRDSSSYIMIWTFIGALGIILGHSGVIIDVDKGRYKNYSWVFGLKSGKWESLDDYPDLVLLRNKRSTGYSINGGGTTIYSNTSVNYELYFASKNHLRKELICKFDDKDRCYAEAQWIGEQTDRELVQYNPGMQNPRKKL